MTKSEFARSHGVNPAAVSNWIRRGHLTAPALRTDGTIDVALAEAQLRERVRPVYQAAAMTRSAPAASAGGSGDLGWAPAQQASLQLLKARALTASVEAEKKRWELMAERGRYMPAAEVEAAWSRALSAFLTDVEASLTDLAQTLGLDHAKTLALRRWWRDRRARAADANRLSASDTAEFVEDGAV